MSHMQFGAELHQPFGPNPIPFAALNHVVANDLHVLRRTHRSASSLHRGSTKHRSQRSRSGSNTTMISAEDYEALPTAIQKKYFSSTERLQITQQSAAQKRRKHSLGQTAKLFQRSKVDDDLRPATSQGISVRRQKSQRQASEPSVFPPFFDQENISEEQARWFLTLPDKARKQQFNRKEQIAIAIRCKRALEHSSPDLAQDALRRCLNITRDDDSWHTARQRQNSTGTVDTDILDDDFLDEDEPDHVSVGTVAKEEIEGSEFQPRTQVPEPVVPDTSVARPSSQPSPRSSQPSPRDRRASLTRTFAPVPLPPPILSPVPPVPPLPSPQHMRHFELAGKFPGPTPNPPEPAVEAKQYESPNVRQQLRNYLTPQKFDEALEIGFAVSDDEGAKPPVVSTERSLSQSAPSYHTEDVYGLVYGDSDSLDTRSPKTPRTFFDAHVAIKKPSFDSGISIPHSFPLTKMKTKPRSPSNSAGTREMTIHMTLTRRDLRAPGDRLFAAERTHASGVDLERVDPLALEPLPLSDDITGVHGAFAGSESSSLKGFRKMWRSLKRH